MSNGARHALGVVAGLLLPPLVAAGAWYGIGELNITLGRDFRISWPALGVLVVAGILLAFLIASRLSPVASLLGGLAFTFLGVVPFVELSTGVRLVPDGLLPSPLSTGYVTLANTGMQLLLGVALLVASAFPSRWRGRALPGYVDYAGPGGPEMPWDSAQTPYLPPPPPPPHGGSEDATRPMYRE